MEKQLLYSLSVLDLKRNLYILRRIVCLLILVFTITSSLSQNISLLSVDEGLPQSFVSGIVEDEEGFIWISTRNGLARYDGHKFKVFQHQPNNPFSLTSNFIDFIKKGDGSTLLIRYESGEIDVFDTQTETISRLLTTSKLKEENNQTSRRKWIVNSDGMFWFVNEANQLQGFKIEDSISTEKEDFSFKDDRILDLFEDNDKTLWVLSQKYISSYNREKKSFEKTKIPLNLNTDYTSIEAVLHQRANGELMWADKERLYFFKPKEKFFRFWELPHASTYNIKWISTAPDGREYFESNKVIYSYDDVNGLQQKAQIDIGAYKEIRAFLVDQSGLIWIGANTEGIYIIDLKTGFESFTYKEDFLIDLLKEKFGFKENNLFGLEIIQRSGLSSGYYLRSFKEQNKIWLALNRSVGYYDFNKERLVMMPNLPEVTGGDDFAPVKGVSVTDEGAPMVIDQMNNLYTLDNQNSVWKSVVASMSLQQSKYKNSIPNDFFVDNNKIWISTESDGLIYIDVLTNQVHGIHKDTGLPSNALFGISEDINNDDILWIGSSQGLIRLNKSNFKIEVFSVEEGLPDNMIYSILPDDMGYLWLGTNKGLCRFHSVTYSQRTFTKRHGLSNIEFNRFHCLQLPNGLFAFGGISSGVVFNPKLIQEDTFKPKIAITGIKVNNSEMNEEQKTIPYNTLDKLKLPHDKNTISVEFTALQFSQPQDISYRYRLKGYDKEWVYIKNKREAIYTKIPPGDYILEINASNTSGIWSDYVKQMDISILPPFWNTWWARLGYGVFAFLAIYLFIKYSIRQRVIENEIALKEKEAVNLRKLDEIKTNFFSNITHELRTPLSLIIGPAEMLIKVKDENEQKRLLSIIVKNAENLLKLTNQLLDIAKLEARVLKPHMLWGDIVPVVAKMVRAFSQEAFSKQIDIQLIAPQTAEYLFSPNTLERIVSNLISNALKFSSRGEKIIITLTALENGITLTIKDQGKGIPENELPNIFKRFYKAHTNGNIPGTGIGLSLVQELVEVHKGVITVESSTIPPTGTEFVVFLPFEKRKKTTGIKALNIIDEEKREKVETNEMPLILIVEDNVELAAFLSFSLQQSYNILLAKNGNEGLAIATEMMPDLIISDVLMEGMDGFELCDMLKKNINLNHIPTILLTAKSDMHSKLKGLSMGADDYITKPFNVAELIMRIDNKLELMTYQRNFFYKKLKLLPSHPENYILEKENVHNEFLVTIQEIIDKRIDDEQFGVEELANELHMSRTSLHRKIKSITNLTTGEVIKAYKLKKAVAFLHKGLSISEIAYKTGFTSPSYFTKCFKETYNLTPTEYLHKQEVQPKS